MKIKSIILFVLPMIIHLNIQSITLKKKLQFGAAAFGVLNIIPTIFTIDVLIKEYKNLKILNDLKDLNENEIYNFLENYYSRLYSIKDSHSLVTDLEANKNNPDKLRKLLQVIIKNEENKSNQNIVSSLESSAMVAILLGLVCVVNHFIT